MAEDMTYEPVTDVTTLAARVAELETALREQCELAATLMQQRTELEARLNATGFALANSALIQRVRELEAQLNAAIVGATRLERENAALRAKLDAVPVEDIKKVNAAAENDGYSNWAVAVWLDELEQQADTDTDTSADGLVIPDDGGDE